MSTFNFFERLTITAGTFSDFRVSWSFISAGIALLNESTVSGRIIEYSFDGETVHGDLRPNLGSQGIIFDNRHESVIWFRLVGTAPAVVRVETWA
jgi:hypothetical protein